LVIKTLDPEKCRIRIRIKSMRIHNPSNKNGSEPKETKKKIGYFHSEPFVPVLRIRIRDPVLFDPWIQDPGWVENQDPDPL
jgi:hypothetical protein